MESTKRVKKKYVPKLKTQTKEDQDMTSKNSNLNPEQNCKKSQPNKEKCQPEKKPKFSVKQFIQLKKNKAIQNQQCLQSIEDVLEIRYIKKLKQYFLQQFKGASQIQLKCQIYRPSIEIFYKINFKQSRINFIELLKSNPNLKRNKFLIENIFNTLYERMHQKYYYIGKFGQCDDIKKRRQFYFEKTNDPSIKRNFRFYYAIDSDYKINFLFFDQEMNGLEVSQESIRKYQKQCPSESILFEKFLRQQIKSKIYHEQKNEQKDEEISSDQQQRNYKKIKPKEISIEIIIKRIQEILDRDQEQFLLNQPDQDNQSAQQQKYRDIQLKLLQQFKYSVSKIIKTKRKDKNILQMWLKKLALAEKQFISKLPIYRKKRELFEQLDNNDILIVQGETGSGKSTQLPQILCQYFNLFEKNQDSKPILVTQPRKLAARSLAKRVAEELSSAVHEFVDYQTSISTQINPKSKIIFKLDKLILDELKIDETLSQYCCLVIDEAHERTIGIDIILGLLKNLTQKRKGFKIIITSASLDTALFKSYFNIKPLIIPNRMYQLCQIFKPYPNQLTNLNKITRLFNQQILTESKNIRTEYKGNILVFCSCIDEIDRLTAFFQKTMKPNIFKILKLHGKLSGQEQEKVFAPSRQKKIIFATRIAETSITINGIKVVVDPGEDYQQIYNPRTKIVSMGLVKISQSSAKQRAGRAGRTNDGFCFRLYSREEKMKMSFTKTPEIKKTALDIVVLRLKQLGFIKDIMKFPYIQSPDEKALFSAIDNMTNIGCLDSKNKQITDIGRFLLKIPIQPQLSRTILQAWFYQQWLQDNLFLKQFQIDPFQKRHLVYEVNIFEEAIRILSMTVCSNNLFTDRQQNREKAQENRFLNLASKNGDFTFFSYILKSYQLLLEKEKENEDKEKNSQLNKWIKDNYLSAKTLKQSSRLYKQIKAIFDKIDFTEINLQHHFKKTRQKLLKCKNYEQVILSCLITSFSSNLCIFSGDKDLGYTLLSQQLPLKIYGTSILDIQGMNPKWIICQNLYQNNYGQSYCKIAQCISQKFIMQHVDSQILNKYKISINSQTHPFYIIIQKILPTLIVNALKQKTDRNIYKNFQQQKRKYKFFNNCHLIFDENMSKVKIFIKKVNQKQDGQNIKNVEKQISDFYKSFTQVYSYEFIGSLCLKIKDGLQIENISFYEKQYYFIIFGPKKKGYEFEKFYSSFGEVEIYEDRFIFYLGYQTNLEEFKWKLEKHIEYWQSQGQNIRYEQHQTNKKYNVPAGKIKLNFWTGKQNRRQVFILFDKQNSIQAFEKGIKSSKNEFFSHISRHRTSNNDGIILSKEVHVDQIEVKKQIIQMRNEGVLDKNFEMPSKINKIRTFNRKLSNKPYQDWKDEIQGLLKKVGMKKQSQFFIKIWGSTYPEKNLFMYGEIKSNEIEVLKKFQKKYNEQRVLGSQKLHVEYCYEQIATITSNTIFYALQSEYEVQKKKLSSQFYNIQFQVYDKKIKNELKKVIKIKSTERHQLLKPLKIIKRLFTHKTFPADTVFFRYLFNNPKQGDDFLDKIQAKYQHEIHLNFDCRRQIIKIFCEDQLQKDIKSEIKCQLENMESFSIEISYKGKNLNKILQIISNIKQQCKQRKQAVNYRVIYKVRKIKIFGDSLILKKVQKQIEELQDSVENSCFICTGALSRPYRLLLCNHSFCWLCLCTYIKSLLYNQQCAIISCPYQQQCEQKINIHDLMSILSYEEFSQLCDYQIIKYMEKNKTIHRCFSEDCDNIFKIDQAQQSNSFQCNVCGIWYCLICKQSHKGFLCQDSSEYSSISESRFFLKDRNHI